jgi:glycosyltransferase involved in cell wall biosynthesis
MYMKVAHCVTVAPNRCGLYGTARELVDAEKLCGVDAGIIDVSVSDKEPLINGTQEGYPKIKDPRVQARSIGWARRADVYVRHSYIPMEFQNSGKPLVLALHGRPESSFRLEQMMGQLILSTVAKRGVDDRYKAFVTFWPEHLFIWSSIVPKEKLFHVPASVDLSFYSPDGPKATWKEFNGSPNILIADIWREDVLPFNALFAAALFQQKYCKSAKIHILAVQGKNLKVMTPMLIGMKKAGALGVLGPMTTKIVDFYRAADIIVTPHSIATRTVREPLACGVPVVAGSGNRYTPYTANPRDIEGFARAINKCWQDYKEDPDAMRKMARRTAEIGFNPRNTGEAMKKVLETIL